MALSDAIAAALADPPPGWGARALLPVHAVLFTGMIRAIARRGRSAAARARA